MQGTVLFFQSDRSVAFVWTHETDRPFCLLRRKEFSEVWHRIAVGQTITYRSVTIGGADLITDILDLDGHPIDRLEPASEVRHASG